MTNWASVADVLAYTGAVVTDLQIGVAQGVIDIYAQVTPDTTDPISPRDLRLLKQALAYQTVWQANQVDLITRTDVSQVNQDGLSFTPAHSEALILAPLASRCLARVSWRQPRSIRVRQGRGTSYQNIEALQDAWLRDGEGLNDWRPGGAA